MIGYLLLGCAAELSLGVPSADIFISGTEVEGILEISSHMGNTQSAPICTTVYSLEGMQAACDDCTWEADLNLALLSQACIFSDLTRLRFQVRGDRWMVLEQTGWEQWGSATEEEEAWSLRASYALLP